MSDYCDACALAMTNPFSGLLTAGCRGCTVRNLSNLPSYARGKFYEQIRDPAQRVKLTHEVGAEYNRRKALEREWRAPITLREVA